MSQNIQTYEANHIIDYYSDKYNFSMENDSYYFLSFLVKMAINQYNIRYNPPSHIGRFKTVKYIVKSKNDSLNPALNIFLNEFFLKLSNKIKRNEYSNTLTSELLYEFMNSFCPRWPFC